MPRLTKSKQAYIINAVNSNTVQVLSHKKNDEPKPLTSVQLGYLIGSIEFMRSISSKQTDMYKVLPNRTVLLTDISVSPNGSDTAKHETIIMLDNLAEFIIT